ncbi:TonB-dependent receptor [Fibrella aquatica]|uniref:TonB-dependent receptor n=1 Tax=Fibrella aquatica TaxID=3242487 RepID=UPI00351F876F
MSNLYKRKNIVMLFVCFLLTISCVLAQTVRGRVIDSGTGNGIPGASVVAMRTQIGTSADGDGNYLLRLTPGTYQLVISFVGYQSVTVPVTVPTSGEVKLTTKLVESQSSLSELVVIGSRAATARINIESVVPVDVITTKEMKSYAQVDVSQILNFVAPSFNSNRQTVTDGTDHIDPASLRGLGPDQTLVLVNGKRRHNTALVNINGSVGRGSVGTDMNVIPVAAVERVEVLRDGAAAQYGSDAIAGVINVVLKKNYEGLTASLMTGGSVSTMNYKVPVLGGGSVDKSQSLRDGKVFQFDISKGFRIGQRGSVTVSGQIVDRERTNRSAEDNAPTIYLGASGGFPGTGLVPVANRPALLSADAQLVSQRGYNRQNMVVGNSSARNYGVFVNGSLPVATNSEVYFSAGVTHRSGTGYGNNRIPVSRTQQPLGADGSLFYPDGFLPAIEATLDDQSLVLGYKTKLGEWNVDLSNVYGRNSIRFDVLNSGNATLPSAASQQTDFYAGTLKFNQNTTNLDFSRLYTKVSGFNTVNVAFGAEYRRDGYQIVAGESTSYSGVTKVIPLASMTIGGPSSGTGLALPGAQVFPGYQPDNELNESRSNISLYGDVEAEITSKWLVDLAGRYENYSDFGSQVTGKLASRYKFAEFFSLRGAVSTGFRAPSLQQRYFNNTSTQFVNGLPSNTLTVNNESPIARTVIGVDALKPETSVNYTLGFAGRVGRNFTMTVDAYLIDIKDRILYSGPFSRTLLGFSATDYPGVNIVRFFANAANTQTKGLDIVATERLNLGKGRLTLSAAVNFNQTKVTAINPSAFLNSTANNEARGGNPDSWPRTLFFDRSQVALLETGLPRSKFNLSAAYTAGKFDVSFRTVRFGEVRNLTTADPTTINAATGTYWNTQFARDASGNALLDQTFGAIWISDITVGYKLTKILNLQVGANNVFDVYPDQLYVDPRNAQGSLDYNSGRDLSNRGRFLYPSNQGGFNGRFLFARLSATL